MSRLRFVGGWRSRDREGGSIVLDKHSELDLLLAKINAYWMLVEGKTSLGTFDDHIDLQYSQL
jgi:hypothetical protein